MITQVSPVATVKLDGSGNGQVSLGPPSGTKWQLRLATTSIASPVKQPQVFLYRGSASGPQELIDSTYTGASGSSGKVAGAPFFPGQLLWAKCSGGDAGATFVLQVFGQQGLRSDPFDGPSGVAEGFANPVTAGTQLVIPAIDSPNFVSGSAGWSINADGSAEFNNATVRGTINAGSLSAGSIGSSNIVNSAFNGGTVTESTITFDANGGVLYVYSNATTSQTFTSGTGTWTAPAGVTSVKAEAWGGGASGGYGAPNNSVNSGGGGGGGEYAAELTLAVTAGNSYPYAVGAGGTATGTGGVAGGNSTVAGDSTTVTAHGAGAFTGSGTAGGPGGTGSTNSVHFNGGGGGNGGAGVVFGGGGGGSSAGTSMAGTTGGNGDSGGAGGSGGVAPSGGGNGGMGTFDNGPHGTAGSAPGGGGGANGSITVGFAAGAAGQVRLTWVTSKVLIGVVAPSSGTDPTGSAYPAGLAGVSAGIGYVTLDSSARVAWGAAGGAADVTLARSGAGVLALAGKLTSTDTTLPVMATDATSGTTTANVYSSALTGASVLSVSFVATKPQHVITVGAIIIQQGASGPWNQYMAPVVTGSGFATWGPNDDDAAQSQFTNNNVGCYVAKSTVVTGLTIGTTYTVTPQYKTSGGVQTLFKYRRIVVA